MELNVAICERARLSRDPRFDGRFFIGVTTTGVYCRPICPAQPPKRENVRFFPSAAAAAEAGFRPCLRCRPEASPGTPAWLGTSTTVSRALKLIGESALDNGDVDKLSERLGIGSRHLRRLFVQHLGAPPVAVAQTRRLHFAKKLIDETNLPLAQVAFTSGFGSIRRFNAAFRQIYGRTPKELRTLAGAERRQTPPNCYLFKLPYRPPYDWNSLTGFLAARAIPGVEAVDENSYRRTITVDGACGTIEVRHLPRRHLLELRIEIPDPRYLFLIVERARRMFDLGAEPAEIARHLRRDALLRPAVEAYPGLRVPGAWDGFELAVRAILGQQISVKGATTLAGRLVKAFGTPLESPREDSLAFLFPAPVALACADLSSIGLTGARTETIRCLAKAVSRGLVTFASSRDADAFVRELIALPGIGQWTAQYVAMRALNEPDAFPSSDLGLLLAASSRQTRMTPKTLEQRAEAWRPWRAYAAMYLWRTLTT